MSTPSTKANILTPFSNFFLARCSCRRPRFLADVLQRWPECCENFLLFFPPLLLKIILYCQILFSLHSEDFLRVSLSIHLILVSVPLHCYTLKRKSLLRLDGLSLMSLCRVCSPVPDTRPYAGRLSRSNPCPTVIIFM